MAIAVRTFTDDELENLLRRAVEPLREELAQVRAELARARRREPSRPDEAGHIDIVKLSARLGKDRSTIARWCRAGRFPAPHYCGNLRCWFRRDVEAWEAERPGPAERGDDGRTVS